MLCLCAQFVTSEHSYTSALRSAACTPVHAIAVCCVLCAQALHWLLTGLRLRLGIGWLFYVSALLLLWFVPGSLAGVYFLLQLRPWQVLPVLHCALAITNICHVWVCSYAAVASLACQLAARLQADCDRHGLRALRLHRLLWLRTAEVGRIHGYTAAWLDNNVFWKIEMPDSGKVASSTPDFRKNISAQQSDPEG